MREIDNHCYETIEEGVYTSLTDVVSETKKSYIAPTVEIVVVTSQTGVLVPSSPLVFTGKNHVTIIPLEEDTDDTDIIG